MMRGPCTARWAASALRGRQQRHGAAAMEMSQSTAGSVRSAACVYEEVSSVVAPVVPIVPKDAKLRLKLQLLRDHQELMRSRWSPMSNFTHETAMSLTAPVETSMSFGTVDFEARKQRPHVNLFDYADMGEGLSAEETALVSERIGLSSYSDLAAEYRAMNPNERSRTVHALMKSYFGHAHFRPGQYEVIDNVLQGKSVIAVMPTGHGKSLCYQLPGLVNKKPTLVISPLIALMEEQVTTLKLKGIRAAYSGKGEAYAQDWDTLDVLFMSPESATLQSERLEQTDFGLIAIDEAHCVSEWGGDFRPKYKTISFLHDIHPHVPLLQITATATREVVDDVAAVFGMKDYEFLSHSFNRPNLHYSVRPVTETTQDLIAKICKTETCSIVYCLTIKECERLHAYLLAKGVNTALYHGKMATSARMKAQEAFMSEEATVIVCTVAFGMGIDKPNVRHVIHYGNVKSMTDYYQQTGRAGRDGRAARCTMFISPHNLVRNLAFILNRKQSDDMRARIRDEVRAIVDFVELDPGTCRRVPLMAHFGERYAVPAGGCGACDHCDRSGGSPVARMDLDAVARPLLGLLGRWRQPQREACLVATFKGSVRGWRSNIFFGAGKMYSEYYVQALVQQLRVEGLVERLMCETTRQKTGLHAMWLGVQITEAGRRALKASSKKIITRKPIQELLLAERRRKRERGISISQTEMDIEAREEEHRALVERVGGPRFHPLYELLLTVRKQKAGDLGVTATALLSDEALAAVSRARPSSAEALAMIPGVPDAFAKEHSTELVMLITDYCTEKGLDTDAVCTIDLLTEALPPLEVDSIHFHTHTHTHTHTRRTTRSQPTKS